MDSASSEEHQHQQPVFVAFNKPANRDVPFQTASDAAMVNLVLTHGLPAETVQTVGKVICQPEFEDQDVPIVSSGDIHRHVGRGDNEALGLGKLRYAFHDGHQAPLPTLVSGPQNDNVTNDSASVKPTPILQAQQGISDIVLENLLLVIAEAMDSVFAEVRYSTAWQDMLGYIFNPLPGSLKPFRKLLLTMSLVHPSWTFSCYRFVGRYLSLTFKPDSTAGGASLSPLMMRCLSSPVYGAWTRGLEVGVGLSRQSDIELFQTLCASKLSNLRCLKVRMLASNSLDYAPSRTPSPWRQTFLDTLRVLPRLEELHLSVDDALGCQEDHVFATLMEGVVECVSPTLKFFRLVGAGVHPRPVLFPALRVLEDRSAVETVNVQAFSGQVVEHMTWKRSENDGKLALYEVLIDNLMQTYCGDIQDEGVRRIRDVLSSVQRLLIAPPLTPERLSLASFTNFLELSSSLRHLHITAGCTDSDMLSQYPDKLLSLYPPSVTSLAIQFEVGWLVDDTTHLDAVFAALSYWVLSLHAILKSKAEYSELRSRFASLKSVKLQIRWLTDWFINGRDSKHSMVMKMGEAKDRLEAEKSRMDAFLTGISVPDVSFEWRAEFV